MNKAIEVSISADDAAIFYLIVASATTGNIVLTTGSPTTSAAMMMSAVYVVGLKNIFQAAFSRTGGGSAPNIPGIILNTVCSYTQAAFLLINPGGAFTWNSPFISGAQDVSNGSLYTLTEGYAIEQSLGTIAAGLSGTTPSLWDGIAAVFS